MKKLLIILTIGFSPLLLFSQSPLDERLSIDLENESLENALYELLEQAESGISFNNDLIPEDKFITIRATDKTLREILNTLLSGTNLTYQVIGAQVVIKRKPPSKRKFTISGFVEDLESGERLIGANVYENIKQKGATTNEYGFFSLTLTEGSNNLVSSYLGYQMEVQPIELQGNMNIIFKLKSAYLTEVIVRATNDSVLIESENLSIENLAIENFQRLPGVGGEADIVRSIQSLPGIQSGADGFGGLSIRGGDVDQNLFLLDGVPVYNSLHAVGVYSIYNTSAVKGATLLKGSFPAKYGGRVSGVLDVQTKEGNNKKHVAETDFGLTSGKISVEGPIIKDKASYFISGRRAFFDFYSIPVTTRLRDRDSIDGYIGYFFYDFNAKANIQLNEKDRIFLSFYTGRDDFRDVKRESITDGTNTVILRNTQDVIWGNEILSFRWNRVFNHKLFGNANFTYSRYYYDSKQFVELSFFGGNDLLLRDAVFFKYLSNNKDLAARFDFDYHHNENHLISFGLSAIRHRFSPGVISIDEATQIDTIDIETVGERNREPLESYEFDAYIQDEVKFGEFLHANIGLRFSTMGVKEKTYFSLQPRMTLKFFPEKDFSLSLSVSKVTQHLHLLSPSSVGLPKDIWVSSTSRIEPQQSWQFVTGFDLNLGKGFSFGMEGYYKKMKNLISFNQVFLDNVNSFNWQDKVSIGKGWAYGVEMLFKMEREKTSGWLSYTLGKSERQFDDKINEGNKFPFRLDRRHNVNLVFLYKINPKIEFTASWQYATGSAFTLPTLEYLFTAEPQEEFQTPVFYLVPIVPDKNSRRLADYHHLDFGFNFYLKKRKLDHIIKVGAYNIYNRKNPLYISLRDRINDEGLIERELIQVSLLPIFPALRYILKFS